MDSDVRREEAAQKRPVQALDPIFSLTTTGLEIEDLLNGINLVVQPNDRFAQYVLFNVLSLSLSLPLSLPLCLLCLCVCVCVCMPV